jgi:V/A-type H+/Na+-transporting ATPase subunit E
MENKLDNLTQKIYQEGIEKANVEGEKIISNARNEAEMTIRQAKEEAERIKNNGEKEAEEIKRNTMASLKLAGTQAISSLKQQIKDLLAVKILKEPANQLFVDASFLKELILSITKNWDHKEGITLNFSPSMQDKINKAFEASIRKEIENLTITYDQRLTNGFTITPQNGSFQITFTDQDFVEFFKPYVRDKAEKILFDNES